MGRCRTKPLLRKLPDPIYIFSFICTGLLVIIFIFWITLNHSSQITPKFTLPIPIDAELMMPRILEHMTWSEGENVLDYGCGNGVVGFHLIFPHVKKHHGHQYALEYSQTNFLKAQKYFPATRITYAQGNLLDNSSSNNFPFKEVTFDKIFAIYVFHLVHNLKELMLRFRTILKQEGTLGFTSLTANNVAFQMATKISQLGRWKQYLKGYETTFHPLWSTFVRDKSGEMLLRNFFLETGFRVKFLKVESQKFLVPSLHIFLDGLFWLSPIYEKVPVSMIPDLKVEMRKQFTQITGITETTDFEIDNEYILGVLQKY